VATKILPTEERVHRFADVFGTVSLSVFISNLPFKNAKPGSKWRIFADGFAEDKEQHKQSGIAMAPDESIFVSDDAKGTIYRIAYKI